MDINFLKGSEKDFFNFILDIDDKDKIAILAHKDLDGMISALMMEKLLGKVDIIKFKNYKSDLLKELKGEFKKKINKLIVLDMSLESQKNEFKKISEFVDILIIDHHQWKENINSKNIKLILTEKHQIPSFVCYKLGNKITDLKKYDFLISIALVSDFAFKQDKSFIEKIENKYNLKKNENIWESEIGLFTKILNNFLICFEEKFNKSYNTVKELRNFHDIKKTKKHSNEIEKELERLENDFEKNKETFNFGYFYFMKSKFKMGSVLSNYLSNKKQNKLFIIFKEYNLEVINISARNQSKKYNCCEILKQSVKDIPNSNAGGHIPAAGAEIPKKYLNKFKENLIKVIKNLSK